ncbi:MAG TPA: DUF4384 domain-containing protein [Bryobacteraceae bacterium]|jgi:hypothetical protein|nr:DUF4384 domain-containing protein [Bryobacteraceae bacterium]
MARFYNFLPALMIFGYMQFPATSLAMQAEQEPQLNARDAFWSAADLVGKRPAEVKTAERKSSNKRVESSPVKVVTVSAPLGLRYSVLKQREDGTYQEISPEAVFHAGDRIRLSLMSNQEGYLYVVEKGSSGKWIPLYPGGTPQEDSNKLAAGKEYIVPGKGAWEFKGDAGQERLFVLLSREPEADLNAMIVSLRDRKEAGLDNQEVAHLRGEVQSRDLVFATGDDDSSDKGDKANYVVNKASDKTTDPHVVVDVVLSHK